MAVNLRSSEFDMLTQTLGEEELSSALQTLMDANINQLDDFMEFVALLDKENGDISKIIGMKHQPVPIEEFLDSDYFLGELINLYPAVRQAVIDICEGGYIQALLTGAVGVGKTTLAQVVQARHVYLMSCERWPQARLGLSPTSTIVIACLNRTADLARDVTFGEFKGFMEQVPYFRETYLHDIEKESRLVYPGNIRVEYSAAFSLALLGKNVIGAICDEMNFQMRVQNSKLAIEGRSADFDQAERIYRALVIRRKSRFLQKGKLPGCLCIVSSANYAGDFTDRLKKETLAENDSLTYIWEKALWDVKSPDSFSGHTFQLEVGDTRYNSRILEDDDEPREDAQVLTVPIEFRRDFERDMETTLAEVAGITVASTNSFFYDRNRVWAICAEFAKRGHQPLFKVESVDLSRGLPEITKGYQIVKPNKARAVHIDLAVTRDRCGFAMAYVDDLVMVSRQEGFDRITQELPTVVFDVLLQITPPRGGEVEFELIRQLLYMLREFGFPIRWISLDGYQSVDSRQILKKQGFLTDLISVVGIEPYTTLRTGIWQGRVAAQEHEICLNELVFLEEDEKHKKVDHLPGKHNDVSDAMCGAYMNLMLRKASWRSEVPFVEIVNPGTGERSMVRAPFTGSGRRDPIRRDPIRR